MYVKYGNFWFETPCKIHVECHLYTLYQLYEYDWQDCNATSHKEMLDPKIYVLLEKKIVTTPLWDMYWLSTLNALWDNVFKLKNII